MSGKRGLPPRLALFFACIPLFGWWMTGLFDLDEGFYGAVVAEMNRRGEWITPYYNGQVWFEKPILLYWLAKPCVALFGMDFGPRVPSVVCTILLFVVCGFFAKKRYGEEAQTATYFCLGTCLLVLVLGRMMMTDPMLNLALATAFLSFYESLVGDKRWRLLTAFSLGLGVLAKGPVALLLFGMVFVIALWRDKSLRENLRGLWIPSFGILIATISCWYVPCYLQNGDVFIQKFLIEQNWNRFLGGDVAHTAGLISLPMHFLVVGLAICPWGWIERKAFTKANLDDSFARFLLTWALVILVFFTISKAKLPHYILPVLPAMALLVAKRMAQAPKINWRPEVMMGLPVVFLLLLDPIQRIWYTKSGQIEAHTLVRKHPEIEVLYQLGKQEKVLKTGTTQLQETSLPSLIMYMNKTVIQGDQYFELYKGGTVAMIFDTTGHKPKESLVFFTRRSRIPGLLEAHPSKEIKVIEETENFGVYQLVTASPQVRLQREVENLIRKHPNIQVLFQLGRQQRESNTSTDQLDDQHVASLAKLKQTPLVTTNRANDLFDGTAVTEPGGDISWMPQVFITRKSRLPALGRVKVIEETENFGVYQLIAK